LRSPRRCSGQLQSHRRWIGSLLQCFTHNNNPPTLAAETRSNLVGWWRWRSNRSTVFLCFSLVAFK
jgi:hypothetical protein